VVEDRTQLWNDLAAQIAIDGIRATTAAGSGHPTSSASSAHLLAVLFADHLRMDVEDPKFLGGDRFVLSKGHAAPGLYAALKAVGAISDEQLLSLRKLGSALEGHPVPIPQMPWVDVATGSLGHGMANGLGMALAKRIDGAPGTIWVLMGDSEVAEGSVWEAMEAAAFHGVDNLVGILDMNALGQRGPTMHRWDGDFFRDRAEALGWKVQEIDGHDVVSIDHAYTNAIADDRPTLIVARTKKGWGILGVEEQEGWQGKPLPADMAEQAIAALGGERHLVVTPPSPPQWSAATIGELARAEAPRYTEPVATRKAFGETLAWLAGHRPDLVVLDGEVGNSTYTEDPHTRDRLV
jgi:transketolase